jgi:hypothetical protein
MWGKDFKVFFTIRPLRNLLQKRASASFADDATPAEAEFTPSHLQLRFDHRNFTFASTSPR